MKLISSAPWIEKWASGITSAGVEEPDIWAVFVPNVGHEQEGRWLVGEFTVPAAAKELVKYLTERPWLDPKSESPHWLTRPDGTMGWCGAWQGWPYWWGTLNGDAKLRWPDFGPWHVDHQITLETHCLCKTPRDWEKLSEGTLHHSDILHHDSCYYRMVGTYKVWVPDDTLVPSQLHLEGVKLAKFEPSDLLGLPHKDRQSNSPVQNDVGELDPKNCFCTHREVGDGHRAGCSFRTTVPSAEYDRVKEALRMANETVETVQKAAREEIDILQKEIDESREREEYQRQVWSLRSTSEYNARQELIGSHEKLMERFKLLQNHAVKTNETNEGLKRSIKSFMQKHQQDVARIRKLEKENEGLKHLQNSEVTEMRYNFAIRTQAIDALRLALVLTAALGAVAFLVCG